VAWVKATVAESMDISAHLPVPSLRHEPLGASGDIRQRLMSQARYCFYPRPFAWEPAETVFSCKGTMHLFYQSQAKAEMGEMPMKGQHCPQFQKTVTTPGRKGEFVKNPWSGLCSASRDLGCLEESRSAGSWYT
jgi:hypothetical protein